MLAAAHVLAMDAKNLLDVVDCIRERHPHIDWRAALQQDDDDPQASSPSPSPSPHNQNHSPNQVLSPQPQNLTTQSSLVFTPQPQNNLSTQSSLQEDAPPKPDFKINQPVTTVATQMNLSDHVPKEHNSLPITTNRVSTLIHNYNIYGNVREPQHIYGNEGVSFQHSQSCDDSKIDLTPIESVKSRVQAMSGKLDSPPIYSVSKKMVPLDQSLGHDQG